MFQYSSQSRYALNLFMGRIDVKEDIHIYSIYDLTRNGLEFVSEKSTAVYTTNNDYFNRS